MMSAGSFALSENINAVTPFNAWYTPEYFYHPDSPMPVL